MHLPKPFFKSIHGFSLVWKEKQYYFEGGMGRSREEVFTQAAFLCIVALREDRHKNGGVKD